MSGEPEAFLSITSGVVSPGQTLAATVGAEITEIRRGMILVEYLEDDYPAKEGIVSYAKRIDGHDVGFIKYRAAGIQGETPVLPRSVTEALLLKDGKFFRVQLT